MLLCLNMWLLGGIELLSCYYLALAMELQSICGAVSDFYLFLKTIRILIICVLNLTPVIIYLALIIYALNCLFRMIFSIFIQILNTCCSLFVCFFPFLSSSGMYSGRDAWSKTFIPWP